MAAMRKYRRPIRVGVVGVRRGKGFARDAARHGMKLVAMCDTWEQRLRQVCGELKVPAYTDYEKFLQHDMDAVVLANYFHQHAPFAVKALRAGLHVMSETAACFTLAEGVELVEAVEKSGRAYMFAENYPYMLFNQEMKRIYQAGLIGQFMYGEGEYVHPGSADWYNSISPGVNHWRNWIPATYYCTHALGPLMFITETWPAKVNGFVIPRREDDPVLSRCARRHDPASMIAVRMGDGSVCKLLQFGLRGEGIWVRVHGSRGQMENLRGADWMMLRLRREQYHQRLTTPVEQIYLPNWPKGLEAARREGHGGGDFFMNHHFARAIRTGAPPFLDVYRGVAMSIVGILAYRSALNDSATLEVPDFRQRKARDRYRDDHWNPDPARRAKDMPWPSVEGDVRVPPRALAYARKIWRKQGYNG